MVLFFDRQGLKVIGVGLMLGVSSYMHGEINEHMAPCRFDGSSVVLDSDHSFSNSSQVAFLRVNRDTCASFARLSDRVVVSSVNEDFELSVLSHWRDLWRTNALLGRENGCRYQLVEKRQSLSKYNQDIIVSQPIRIAIVGNSFDRSISGNSFPYIRFNTSNTDTRAGPWLFL